MHSTETVNPRFANIDGWQTIDAVEAMLEGQMAALAALMSQAKALASAAEAAADRLQFGGRLVYVGAGTSGRIAVQDGVELTPTFGWPEERLIFAVAGGSEALLVSVEGAEDDQADAVKQLKAAELTDADVVIGVAASGRTPFTIAALAMARDLGAVTIGLANNAKTPLLDISEFPVLAETGSELVAGSTRMKAGTAQKAALNILSTSIMLRLGRVHRGLMVDMVVSNAKLLDRAHRMVSSLSGCSEEEAVRAVALAGKSIKKAVLVAKGVQPVVAASMLERSRGVLRTALEELEGTTG